MLTECPQLRIHRIILDSTYWLNLNENQVLIHLMKNDTSGNNKRRGHAFRLTSFKLWQQGEMTLSERKDVITAIESILYPLKNSVEKHIKDGDAEALGKRINFTVDELKRISDDLYKLGSIKAADFIREYSNYIVTFARLALEGRKVPWNSNIIERLMGEISKRAKHKWMRWTTRGLEAIMKIILTRYSCERIYETFKGNMMKNENLNYIKCEVNVIPVRGEL